MRDDIRNALRSLRASRGFTFVALTVLALGIGAGTAIFSVVDAVVLRGLPYDQHDRLGVIYEKDTKRAVTFGEGSSTPQTYFDWRPLQQPFQQITAIAGTQFRLKTEIASPRTPGPSASRSSSSRCCAWRRCSGARSTWTTRSRGGRGS